MSARQQIKQLLFKSFILSDRLGLHVLPKHYYSPIPDYEWLAEHKDLWTNRIELHGVEWNLDRQLAWLSDVCAPYYTEVRGLEFYNRATADQWGPGFGAIESQVLHCVMRSFAPRRIIEIGSGVSTACMSESVRMNEQDGKPRSEITCIEPFPRPVFSSLRGVRHIKQLCQQVPLSLYRELESGDLLFIDSSHAVKTGSDVVKIYLEIIPNLAPGVIIHIHDVYLPYVYPRDALTHVFGWQEMAMLAALLTNNDRLSVLTCLSALHYDCAAALQEVLSDYRPQANDHGLQPPAGSREGYFPASLWMCSR